MSLPRYSGYKDSEVEWLGEVPEHWDIRRVRRIFVIKKRIAGKLGFDILSITQQGIKVRDPESNDGQVSMDYSKYQVVEPGDFAMNHMDLLTGYVDISRRLGVTSPDYRVFSIAEHCISDSGYLLYIFQMGYKQKILYAYGQGSSQLGRWRLPTEGFQEWAIPFPSHEEQGSISTFLDRETAKIDALIAEQQLLIELLQEKRQVVISHAVTKGLNPSAPMKDSGVQWLGEVPEHWAIKKLRYVCKIQTGSRDTEEAIEDGEYPFFVRSQTVERINSYSYDCEAVLTAGDGAGVGKVFHYHTGSFDFHQRVYMLNEFNDIHGKLIYHFLKTNFFKVALQGGAKSTVDSLRRPMFTGFPVCIPPIQEQGPLLEFVETEEKRIDKLIATSVQAVSLLQERRSALISAAVTGQIDVRGIAEEVSA